MTTHHPSRRLAPSRATNANDYGGRMTFFPPPELLAEICGEARRLDRTVSWVMQQAWRLAREEIRKMPPDTAPSKVRFYGEPGFP
jgi:uncharacterized small protein (TIGR04563 family)